MVNPFTNVRRRPGTETGMPARSRAIGIALASATALTMASCHSATPSQQASPEPEAWEMVVAEDPLFDDRLTDGVVESLCTTASSTMNRTDPDLPANLEWDGGNYSCGGSVSIPTSSDPVVLTPYLSFSRLNEYEQKSLAQHLLKKDNETSVCILTAFLQSSGEGTQTERETTNGEYCYY
ncbi:MAG TPA: hypothetical protein H9902_16250, partial [Candidatus Stackebrandtia faecavium]|nr:hypothetical protein [Candidatus Stackebrandtia faecavium]